jgi:hypothetical protein
MRTAECAIQRLAVAGVWLAAPGKLISITQRVKRHLSSWLFPLAPNPQMPVQDLRQFYKKT